MNNITYTPKAGDVERLWFVVDATDKILGRLASEIAQVLRGKRKPQYAPHADVGDHVIVINAEKIKITGNKAEQKVYYRHTGYPGGLRTTPYRSHAGTASRPYYPQGGAGHAAPHQTGAVATQETSRLRRW